MHDANGGVSRRTIEAAGWATARLMFATLAEIENKGGAQPAPVEVKSALSASSILYFTTIGDESSTNGLRQGKPCFDQRNSGVLVEIAKFEPTVFARTIFKAIFNKTILNKTILKMKNRI
ncbi:MAG: hypothetical protein ABSG88_19545 [Bradyrhizobium sp.]